MKFVSGLACHLCGKTYPPKASWVCSDCLGPLEVHYDYAAVKKVISRQLIESRPPSLWRYQELLPVESPKFSTWTPMRSIMVMNRLHMGVSFRATMRRPVLM